MLQSVYDSLLNDMIEIQNEYYIPLILISLVVMASMLMYKKSNNTRFKSTENNNKTIPSPIPPEYQYSSSLSPPINNHTQYEYKPPNQKYRKHDPETRYDDDGTRYQCIAIPYRIINNKVEIFMITSRGKGDYIFPGGGWELNETKQQCTQRELYEEAGVRGNAIKELISDVLYTSDKGNKSRLWGYLFHVNKVLDTWPEPQRRRKWMSIDEVDIALSEKRRVKFGKLWNKAVEYFTIQNLYKNNKKITTKIN
eukprot:352446_1